MGNPGRKNNLSTRLTRRKFLKAAGAGAAWIALTSALPGCEPSRRAARNERRATALPAQSFRSSTAGSEYMRSFRSRPDLHPPTIDVLTPPHDKTAPGYIFVAPKNGPGEQSPNQDGPLILDNSGEPLWFYALEREDEDTMDFKVQYYQGEPVITFWKGHHTGFGQGEYVILDTSYKEIARVGAGNGYLGDHHEFLITDEDTALITIYGKVEGIDLSGVGGPKDGAVREGIAQEVEIESGEVIFEWHSLEHVGVEDSYADLPKNPAYAFDYFHINSIDVDHDSNLLISSRNTSTVYKVDRKSGEVMWRLGGEKSSFEMGPGARINFQHDARRQPDGTITIFDNGSVETDDRTYGIVLEVDEDNMTTTLVRRYPHPEGRIVGTQGSVQILPNDNVFIGWGSNPLFSEFSRDGQLLYSASFPPQVESYRAFRFPWSGHPGDDPAVAVEEAGSGDEITIFASWNGATEVASWQVVAGSSPEKLEPVGSAVPREGFETAMRVKTSEAYVGVEARDSSGRVLGSSRAVGPIG